MKERSRKEVKERKEGKKREVRSVRNRSEWLDKFMIEKRKRNRRD